MQVTDEVVELAAQAYNDAIKTDAFGDVGDDQHCDAMEAALEAALPHLAPQPVVDREAVEVEVCKVIADFFRDDERFTSYHATSLTARLLPLIGSRPQTGVVHVQHADAGEYARIFNIGFAEAVEQYNDSPLLDREAVKAVLARRLQGEQVVDLLIELARPMPTREQIAEAMHTDQMGAHAWRQGCAEDTCIRIFNSRADAILALLTGSAK